MLNTPEEKLEHLFDELIWAWYLTCLPADRRSMPQKALPEEIEYLLTSPMIANLILTRWQEGLAPRLDGLAWHAKLIRSVERLTQKARSEYTASERAELRKSLRIAQAYLEEHKQRMAQLSLTREALVWQLCDQVPWMLATFTRSEQQMLSEIATWYCRQIPVEQGADAEGIDGDDDAAGQRVEHTTCR